MYKTSGFEKIILFLVFGLLGLGFILYFINEALFTAYTQEDGFIEWMTVMGSLMGSFVCLRRVWLQYAHKSWLYSVTNIVLGLLLFFVAGEEISWGQRLLGIESSTYFLQHNSQGETNIHNLVVDKVKLNKVIFTFVLIGLLAIYLVIVPIVYNRYQPFQTFVNWAGAPIPRLYQVLAFGGLFLLTALLPHEKNAELLEFGAAFLFMLVVCFPVNKQRLANTYAAGTAPY